MTDYIIIGLLVLIFIGVIIAIAKSSKKTEVNDNSEAVINAVSALKQDNLIQSNEILKRIGESNEKQLERQQDFMQRVNDTMGAIRRDNAEQGEKITKTLSESIDKMTQSNEKKLEEMRVTVDEKLTSTLTTRLNSSFKTVSEQLEKLYTSLGEMKELSGGITSNVTNLNRILTNVKARGTWAEYQLESILEQTLPSMFVKNYQPEGVKDFVEFAIKIPSGDGSGKVTFLPVDSKFPMEDYVRLCDAADRADAEGTAAARKALEKRITDEAKAISKYISVPETTPFAIMYLATEGLYAEVASSKSGIIEKVQNEFSVMIAGPATITALLNSIAMGMRTIAVNEKANEIKLLLGAVKKQYDMFDTVLSKVKKKIGEADTTLDDATKRNNIIRKKLRDIEAVDSAETNTILGIEDGSME